MPRAVQRKGARRDFLVHYVYLAEHAGLDVASRFRHSVEQTYEDLAKMPEMGSERASKPDYQRILE
jgi:toxin ParE1/3/4